MFKSKLQKTYLLKAAIFFVHIFNILQLKFTDLRPREVQTLRKDAGYTSYEYFAYENNISRPQYGKYEGGANIQLNTLIRILSHLNISLEDFFKGM